VRLAQRVPVRIKLDELPHDSRLVAPPRCSLAMHDFCFADRLITLLLEANRSHAAAVVRGTVPTTWPTHY
jgi:multidrug resistance efflux pump